MYTLCKIYLVSLSENDYFCRLLENESAKRLDKNNTNLKTLRLRARKFIPSIFFAISVGVAFAGMGVGYGGALLGDVSVSDSNSSFNVGSSFDSTVDSVVLPIVALDSAVDSALLSVLRSSLDSAVVGLDSAVIADNIAAMDSVVADSSEVVRDTVSRDTVARKPFLEAPIFGKGIDSLVYDVRTKDIYIYKEGDIRYQDMELKADFIKLNTQTKLVHAQGVTDTAGENYTRPVFVQGQTNYELDSMDYNMNSGKARISGVNSKEGEGIMYGGKVKKMKDNVIHMHNGRYTTCDADCPHFYLQMTKGTVIPDKRTVFGPAYMVFEDVPFYVLGLPFGFFPQNAKRHSGFIIPDVGEEVIKGFYLRDGGYYLAFSDYADLSLTAGIYTLGSWQVAVGSSYNKRYKFNGDVRINYAKDVIGEKGAADYVNTSNFQVRWRHSQDPKASPNSSFAANVDYTSSSYNKYNADNLNDYLNSQINSSVSYSKSWAGKPISLGINASMGQNTQDSTFAFTLPSFSFNVQRISPFKRKKPIGKERWYEKISFTYSTQFDNKVTVKEKDLLKKEMFDKMQFGFKHTLPVSASFNVLKYLNVTPSGTYNERWYFRKIDKAWNPETQRVENSDTTRGFYRVYDFTASLGMTTKLYGTYTAGRKNPVVVRHVMTPSISASYTPDFGKPKLGFYKEVQRNEQGDTEFYSPYANEMYGVPSRGQSAALNFSLGNTLEMKVPTKKDTVGFKKIKILESFNIASSYNFLADSLNLAPFAISARTTLFKGFSLQVNGVFDPYQIDASGRKINKFLVSNGGFLRMTSLSFNFGYGFQGKGGNPSGQAAMNNPSNNNNNTPVQGVDEQGNFFVQNPQEESAVDRARQLASQYYDFEIPWSLSFNYTFNYSKPGHKATIMQTVNFNASVNITSKWAVTTSAGYDFQQKQLTPGAITITRDLHCWQMNFTWIPIGFRQSWNFTIQAKSSMLADVLKYKKDRSFLDNYYNN